ncbi:hypothetical protein VARIO8X_20382 [Burkholderiales bacterium 8X]|nr:hypothetical protein VARIO8X_20382 [Burkholderiales bacterium 8X]
MVARKRRCRAQPGTKPLQVSVQLVELAAQRLLQFLLLDAMVLAFLFELFVQPREFGMDGRGEVGARSERQRAAERPAQPENGFCESAQDSLDRAAQTGGRIACER